MARRRPAGVPLRRADRGIDVGAKAEIYQLMDQLTRDGKAIVMVCSELSELLGRAIASW